MIAVDTSVVVAGFAPWHDSHAAAHAALRRRPRVPAHVVAEAYSVLTRLPPPHRAPADVVVAFLRDTFPGAPIGLPAGAYLPFLSELARHGITGGAIYDALVAEATRRARATLLTRDGRARPIYDLVGVSVEWIGS